MSDADPPPSAEAKPVHLGVFSRRAEPRGLTSAEIIPLTLSVIWLFGVALFFFSARRNGAEAGGDPLRVVMVIVAIFMPIALIWIASLAAGSARVMREESARLQTALDAMRQAHVAKEQMSRTVLSPDVETRLNQLAAAQRKTESVVATFQSTRPAAAAPPRPDSPTPMPEGQASLALGAAPGEDRPPLSVGDFVTALNFPETADDKDGFRALDRAMRDRRARQLVQASQDVLTLLSQEGIYMDDLTPDRARPEIWRRFAEGERGRPIAMLGGIRDRSSIALTAARMRQDPVFRDAVHHFLRTFDHTFAEFEKTAADADIAALSETRTARAFMLLGRVTGTFT